MSVLQRWTSVAWEVVQGVSFEQWGLLILLLLAAGALYFAWRASRSGGRSTAAAERAVSLSEEQRALAEEQRTLAEEQLRLAREQAEMRPDLSVYPESDEQVLLLREEPPKERRSPSQSGTRSLLTKESPPRYQGPGPHGDVVFRLHNDGKTTATNVRGWFYFDAERLKPIDPDDIIFRTSLSVRGPSLVSGLSFEEVAEDGLYEVTMHESSISPGTYNTYRIPVVFLSSGLTRIEYSVVCNEGASAEGVLVVRVPSLEERSRRLKVGASRLSDEELREVKERVWRICCEEWEHSKGSLLDRLDSAVVYERLVAEGVELPDYALIEVLALLQDRIVTGPYFRRSEEDIRKHGGMMIMVVEDI
jgi:hypothetical protein